MVKKNLPKSIKKYIREEKARIRREVLDIKKQEKLINELYPVRKSISQQNEDKRIKLVAREANLSDEERVKEKVNV